ncbi:hypothetical protein [Amycolatopsis sp. cmx-11-12]|uniref:hypothetical protein n=1 Tax=Amycolatopsis sp. cmx-11-12 TaxID=2785795 RepID=UPI003917F02D
MNTGFLVFGITILAGVAALRDLPGRCRWATLVPATLLAVGGVLLALYPGSGEALSDGTGEYHGMGAFAGFIGGNALAIVLGRRWQRIGISAGMGRALITVGVVGLISTVLYLAMIFTAGDSPIASPASSNAAPSTRSWSASSAPARPSRSRLGDSRDLDLRPATCGGET